jgi:hypothetical protein
MTIFAIISTVLILAAGLYIIMTTFTATAHSVEKEKTKSVLTQIATFLAFVTTVSFIPDLPFLDSLAEALGIVIVSFDQGYEYIMWFFNLFVSIAGTFKVTQDAKIAGTIRARYHKALDADRVEITGHSKSNNKTITDPLSFAEHANIVI